MLNKVAQTLGLRFRDPDMESSYRVFNAKIESQLLRVANIISVIITFLVLLPVLLGRHSLLGYRIGNFVVSVVGAFIKIKFPQVSKAILIGTSITLFYFSFDGIQKHPGNAGSALMWGNEIGIFEVIFTLSLKNMPLRLSVTTVNYIMKMVVLDHSRSTLGNVARTGVTIVFILYYLYCDVLERKNFKVIYESREQLKKFQMLLSNDFPSSVLVMPIDFKTILYSNHFFQEKFGSHSEETSSLNIFNKFIINNLPDSFTLKYSKIENLQEFINTLSKDPSLIADKEVMLLSTTFLDDNNKYYYYEIKLRKINWDCKASYALVFDDVSDKQLVMALKIADEQKDKVIATVSHELRTPINGIMGLIEIIASRISDETSQMYLNYCRSCSKLLLHLVNSILDLSQIRHNKLKVMKDCFSLNELLDELKSLYVFETQQRSIKFIIDKARNVGDLIYTDRYRLTEILINLLGNAFKFTVKGSITLKVSLDETDDVSKVAFAVIDTGIGIKEEDKPKLFQMFGKLDQENKNINTHGAGLGLTIANELVRALNDNDENEKLTFESEYRVGTKFFFKIPHGGEPSSVYYENENQEMMNYSRSPSLKELQEEPDLMLKVVRNQEMMRLVTPSSRRTYSVVTEKDVLVGLNSQDTEDREGLKQNLKNILLVDDNLFNILAASFILERMGYNVSKASSGEECLKMLAKSAETQNHYDLILMDIQMPIMDGLEASRIIRQKIENGELYHVPIVALTAKENNESDVRDYSSSGMVDYLQKPLREAELKKVLYGHLMR